jgi:hypothetical protein
MDDMDEERAQEGMNMKIDNGGQKNIQHQVGGGGSCGTSRQ